MLIKDVKKVGDSAYLINNDLKLKILADSTLQLDFDPDKLTEDMVDMIVEEFFSF